MQGEDWFKIGLINASTKKASVKAKLIAKINSKIVNLKKTGESIEVAEYLIADTTGKMPYQVWGGQEIQETDKNIGKTIMIKNGWVSTFANTQRISKGKFGEIEFSNETVKTIDIEKNEIEKLKHPEKSESTTYLVNELIKDSKNVNIKVKIVRKDVPRTVKGSLRVGTFLVGDSTGCILLTLWNEDLDLFSTDDVIEITNGYVSMFQDVIQLNKGKFGQIKKIDEDFKVNQENNLSSDY